MVTVMLAAMAYATMSGAGAGGAIVEPWTSSPRVRPGFVPPRRIAVRYALSMIGALIASLVRCSKRGVPDGNQPSDCGECAPQRTLAAAKQSWGSRRVDIAVLGLFVSPAVVGIYYVAQNIASLPSKLKTSFDPILGPVISRNIAAGNDQAVAKQVRQVGFGVIAAQLAVALALAIPGEAVLGLVGPAFVAGTAALALLFAEVVAATERSRSR